MDTQIGALGRAATRHAQEDSSNALVPALTPIQQTEERTALDWDQLPKQGDVTLNVAQANIKMHSQNSNNKRNTILDPKPLLRMTTRDEELWGTVEQGFL